MLKNSKESQINLCVLTENRLVFKTSSLTYLKNSLEQNTNKITKKYTHSIVSPKSQGQLKNLSQKRIELRGIFETKEAKNRRVQAKNTFEIIGKSESSDNIKNSNRYRNNISNHRTRVPSIEVPPIKNFSLVHNNSYVEDDRISFSNYRFRITRKIVPISNSKLDISDIDDNEDSMIIRSRYYN